MTTDGPGTSIGDRAVRARVAIRAARPLRGLAARSPMHQLARRRLSAWAVAAQSLGSIAPAAAAATTPAVAIAAGTGQSAVLSALLALGIALLVAAAINVFTRRISTSGSLYTFAVKGLGAYRGFMVGCALLLGYAGIAAACVAAAAHYLTRWSDGAAALVASAVVIVVLVTVIVRRGTRSLWPALLVIEVFSVIAVLAASLVLIAKVGQAQPTVAPDPIAAPDGWTLLVGVVVGVVISASGFVGFESGTSLGPEARRPFLIVPRVVRWAPVATGAVLAISTAAQALAFARTGVDPASTASALPDLLAAEGSSSVWPVVLDLAIGASFLAGAVASVTALARLLFALALDRVVPAPLARVHPRHRTPHIALFFAIPVVGGVPIVALALGAPVRGIMDALVAVGVLGYLLAYLGVSVAAPVFLRRIGESTRAVRIAATAAAVILAALVTSYAVYQVMTGSMLPVTVVVVALAVSSLYFLLAIRRRPDIVRTLGVFDSTSAEDLGPGRADDRSPAA